MVKEQHIKIDIKGWLEDKFSDVKSATYPFVHINCTYCVDNKQRLYIAVEDYKEFKKGFCYCHHEQKPFSFFEVFKDYENLTDEEAANQLYDDNPDPVYGTYQDILRMFEESEQIVTAKEPVPVVWPNCYKQMWGLDEVTFNKLVPKYMLDRKLDQTMCDRYFLGFTTVGSKYAGRVIIPIYQNKKLVCWQGRAMHKAIDPKYLFMPGVEVGDFIYNIDNVPDEYDWVILTEGIFDVWAMLRFGFLNTVATFGKHITDTGKKILHKRFKKIVLMYDNDAVEEMIKFAEELIEIGIDVYIALLSNKDPDESEKHEVEEALKNAEMFTPSLKRRLMIMLMETVENKGNN